MKTARPANCHPATSFPASPLHHPREGEGDLAASAVDYRRRRLGRLSHFRRPCRARTVARAERTHRAHSGACACRAARTYPASCASLSSFAGCDAGLSLSGRGIFPRALKSNARAAAVMKTLSFESGSCSLQRKQSHNCNQLGERRGVRPWMPCLVLSRGARRPDAAPLADLFPHSVGPMLHGANSSSPMPLASLLVFWPLATASISSKIC